MVDAEVESKMDGDERASDDRASMSANRRTLQLLPLAVPLIAIASAGWIHRSVRDDGFIYFRIVRQIQAGNGPVFNEGERVETYTGVLWLAILTIVDTLTPFTLEWIAVVIGLMLTVVGVAVAMLGASALWGQSSAGLVVVPVGAIVFIAPYPTWVFATSGLETGLVFAWLGTCLLVLSTWAKQPDRPVSLWSAALIGLGWLVRPELALFSAICLLMLLAASWGEGGWRRRVQIASAAIALPLIYQLFRMAYFGNIVANTATAKDGSSTDWERGRRYFFDFAGPYWLWVPMLLLVCGGYVPVVRHLASSDERSGGISRRAAVISTFAGGGSLLATYVVAVGGDYLHGRLFLPALFLLCAPVAVVPIARAHVFAAAVGVWAVFAAVTMRPDQLEPGGLLANGFSMSDRSGQVTLAANGWGDGGRLAGWYDGPGYYIQESLRYTKPDDPQLRDDLPDDLAASFAVGLPGYSLGSDFFILDLLGLGDAFTAHFEAEPTLIPFPRLAGHEKPLPTPWIAARLTPPGTTPDPSWFPTFSNPLLSPAEGAEFQEQVAWARATLDCDDIVELIESTTAPLSIGRMTENFVGSFRRSRLRIPADPEEAYHRFCGPGTPAEVLDLRASS